jgi:hypothetical protein
MPSILPSIEQFLPFGTAFFFSIGIWWMMGLERPLRKQSGGLFLGRGKVLWMAERSPAGL